MGASPRVSIQINVLHRSRTEYTIFSGGGASILKNKNMTNKGR